ncbi:PREDICTED: tigger transposable element-derived protein 6-like [Vollenhovia emeryi]|uniref:tigger transposable element-derived protein 6-like n=1 Tax=Vollenhovia emeryi TaxID=411798 RepID=UPI0005F50DED|nr:PREDICTED: tigger transposable element-derived protein 6-like [Vollenhovia emeryi]
MSIYRVFHNNRPSSRVQIAKYYNIPKSTLSTIIKNKEQIYESIASGTITPKTKRIRRAQYEDVETEVLNWFNHMRVSNVSISGPLIQEKAKSIADNLGTENFNCLSGWLWRFQVRHGISSQAVCDELNKVNEEHANDWLSTFENIKQKFAPRDIFNMDETGIFFNLYPDRTLSFKGNKCHGGNKSKQRITAVFVCNSDGSEKLPAWIIRKSKQPRCFKHINLSTLTCQYTYTPSEFLDRCRSISPANTTSRLQPLDQGIIALIKKDYRKRLVRAAIQAIESQQKVCQWNILNAIRAIILAWDSVSAESIQKCFTKAWSRSGIDQSPLLKVVTDENSCAEWEYLKSIDINAKVRKE